MKDAAFNGYIGDNQQDFSAPYTLQQTFQHTASTGKLIAESIIDMFMRRLRIYLAITVLALLLLFFNDWRYLSLGLTTWLFIIGVGIICDMITALIDRTFFNILGHLSFFFPNEYLYLSQALRGILGLFILILLLDKIVIKILVANGDAAGSGNQIQPTMWQFYVTTAVIVLILVGVKNLIQLRKYQDILEGRYKHRLFLLDLKIQLLSHLASLMTTRRCSRNRTGTSAIDLQAPEIVQGFTFEMPQQIEEQPLGVRIYKRLRRRFRQLWRWLRGDAPQPAQNKHNPHYKRLSSSATEVDEDDESTVATAMTREDFWDRVSKLILHRHAICVQTFTGDIRIENRQLAEKFGELLHRHLLLICRDRRSEVREEWSPTIRDGGPRCTTGDVYDVHVEIKDVKTNVLKDALMKMLVDIYATELETATAKGVIANPYAEAGNMRQGGIGTTTATLGTTSTTKKVQLPPSRYVGGGVISFAGNDEKVLVWSPDDEIKMMLELLNAEKSEYINRQQFIHAVAGVYEEWHNIRDSFVGYDYVNSTVFLIIDGIFWSIVFIIIGTYFDTSISNTIFVPLMTLLLMFSFALAPMLGTLATAAAFVFFMIPYDVGHRIAVDDKVGNVQHISLMYTTIITFRNEIYKFPNHKLFSKKIVNYYDSGGCRYTFTVNITLGGPGGWSMDRIDAFLIAIRKYVMEDNYETWEDCWIICDRYDIVNNVMQYTFWLTHRIQMQYGQPWQDRCKFCSFLTKLQEEFGYCTCTGYAPVQIVNSSGYAMDGNSVQSVMRDTFAGNPNHKGKQTNTSNNSNNNGNRSATGIRNRNIRSNSNTSDTSRNKGYQRLPRQP